MEKTHRGRLIREWVQTRVRNEAYDCWKYALAGFRLSKIDPAQRERAAQRVKEMGAEAPAPRVVARRIGRIGRSM